MHEKHLQNDVGFALDEDSLFALLTFSVRHPENFAALACHEERVVERNHIVNQTLMLDTSMDQSLTYQYIGDDLKVLARTYTPEDQRENVAPPLDNLILSSLDDPRYRDSFLLPTNLLGDIEPSASGPQISPSSRIGARHRL